MEPTQVYVVIRESQSPRVFIHRKIEGAFTTMEAARACCARLAERWSKTWPWPQFEVEVHDVLAEDHPGPDGWS